MGLLRSCTVPAKHSNPERGVDGLVVGNPETGPSLVHFRLARENEAVRAADAAA